MLVATGGTASQHNTDNNLRWRCCQPVALRLLTGHHDPMPDDAMQRFNVGQRAAVIAAFKLAGYEGELLVAPITSGDERFFLLEPAAFAALRDTRELQQVLTQLLRLKVGIIERTEQWPQPMPFE